MRFNEWLRDQWERAPIERRTAKNLTVGYVTQDVSQSYFCLSHQPDSFAMQSCPGVGDDTSHSPLEFFDIPDFIASDLPSVASDDSLIDVVFLDFIANSVVIILNQIGAGTGAKNFTTSDVKSYTNVLTNEVFGIFAQANWNQNLVLFM